jgi:uncharacterized protein
MIDPASPLGKLVSQHRKAILQLARRHGATEVRVFGSVARGEASVGSDVDFLVTFAPSASVFARLDLQEDLQRLLGVRVDVAVPGALHRLIRDEVLREAVPV